MAWELGSGYGHVDGFVRVALQLRERGHDVSFALKDLSRAEKLLGQHGFPLIQAPVWLPPAPENLPPANELVRILVGIGYLDTLALTGMLKGWRSVFDAAKPDVVLFEHAPTALLASRGRSFAKATIGTGFTCWPAIDGLPALEKGVSAAEIQQAEEHITKVINSALNRLSETPSLSTLADLHKEATALLCTLPGLDPFKKQRTNAKYLGLALATEGGADYQWRRRKPHRIFAYLKYEDPRSRRALHELCNVEAELLVHVPSLDAAEAGRLRAAGANVSMDPLNVETVIKNCDLAVCHAGHAMTGTALLNGCPLLLLPSQTEQLTTARLVEALGVGLYMAPEHGPEHFSQALRQLLDRSDFQQKARDFARHNASFKRDTAVESLIREIETLI